MAYVNGNLALQPKRKENDQEEVYRETRKVVVKRKSLPVGEKLLYLFTIVLCVTVAAVIIFRYTQIYDMNMNMKKLNTQYQTLNVEMEELKRQVEMLSDPERIRKMAEMQGMATKLDGINVKTSSSGDAVKSAMRE
ncbi:MULTISPECIES: cell division protein FtsL [unclassified Paenibacillus]|uniref:cell division protein FtsL n=1 Tax=unclassified Paenibacillus TaxID=185978 RepID=UPI002F4234EB